MCRTWSLLNLLTFLLSRLILITFLSLLPALPLPVPQKRPHRSSPWHPWWLLGRATAAGRGSKTEASGSCKRTKRTQWCRWRLRIRPTFFSDLNFLRQLEPKVKLEALPKRSETRQQVTAKKWLTKKLKMLASTRHKSDYLTFISAVYCDCFGGRSFLFL